MFTHLRASAQSFFAKLILLLLVASFVLWGIGDVFRSGGGAGPVATVGRTPIYQSQYQQELRRKQEMLRQMLGTNYKPELLKKLGVPQQVLGEMINSLVVEKETDELGLIPSDQDIVEAIRTDPQFTGKDERFDKAAYMEFLKERGIAEQRYINDLRKQLATKLLADTLASSVVVPEVLVEALYKARGETRTADIILIPAGGVTLAAQPTDNELKEYYKTHDKGFVTPEYRTFSYILLGISDIESHVDVSEDDIARAYNDRIQDFHVPLRMDVEQMVFANEADAKKAADMLVAGKSFAEVAKSAPITNKGKLAMGSLSKQQLPAEGATEIAALKENGFTQPLKSAFGWHVFHVSKIEPESVTPLRDVHDTIKKDLASRSAQETVYKLVGQLEDALAGGSTMENAAQKVGATVRTVGPVTPEGVTPEGKKIILPVYDNLVNVAFSLPDKEHSQATQLSDGSYFLVHVDAVRPEQTRPFAVVRDQLLAAWTREKQQVQLQKAADDIAADLRSGKKVSEATAAHHVSYETITSGKLKRSSDATIAGKNAPREMVLELFRLQKGQNTLAYKMPDGDEVIAVLTGVAPAEDITSASGVKRAQDIRAELKKSMTNEVLSHYIAGLRSKYGVKVNEAAMNPGEDSGE